MMQSGQFGGESECIPGATQVVHCCNSYLREGGSFEQGGGAGGGVTDFEEERVGGGEAFAANCC